MFYITSLILEPFIIFKEMLGIGRKAPPAGSMAPLQRPAPEVIFSGRKVQFDTYEPDSLAAPSPQQIAWTVKLKYFLGSLW